MEVKEKQEEKYKEEETNERECSTLISHNCAQEWKMKKVRDNIMFHHNH